MIAGEKHNCPSRETLGAFADALRRLVRTKTFEKITVRDIVRESGFSSRTFYNHFRNKYDLILWHYAVHDWENLCAEEAVPPFTQLLRDALQRLEADRALFAGAFADWLGPESLCATLVKHGMRAVPEYIRRVCGEAAMTPALLRLVRFYVEGIVCELARWLSSAKPEPQEEIVVLAIDAMPASLRPLLLPPRKEP